MPRFFERKPARLNVDPWPLINRNNCNDLQERRSDEIEEFGINETAAC